jgi:hypothetical protein
MKQPLQELTWAMFTSLPGRPGEQREGESLDDSRIGLNTVEASNRPRRMDHLKSGPTGHVNPIMVIEIISL